MFDIVKSREKDKKILERLNKSTKKTVKSRENHLLGYENTKNIEVDNYVAIYFSDFLYAYTDLHNKVIIDDINILKNKKVILHNACVQLRDIRNKYGDDFYCYWDTKIFNKILDKDEKITSPEDIFNLFLKQKEELKEFMPNKDSRISTIQREIKVLNIANKMSKRGFTIKDIPEELEKYVIDNKLYFTIDTFASKTGRMYTKNPNVQGFTKELRKYLSAKDGYSLISADFSSQEPRILAYLSQDENMLNAYKNNIDVYSEIASKVFNKDYNDCLEYKDGVFSESGYELRKKAKTILFSIIYGGYSSKDFYEKYPKVKDFIDNINGKDETIYNRKIKINKNPVNTLIQGSASDMTKNTVIKIEEDKELKDLGFELLLPIHDEIIGQCPNENIEKCSERIKYLMENIDNRIMMKVDIKIMKNLE